MFPDLRQGSLIVDRFLMVYDLRYAVKVMTPVSLLIEPCFIHYLPMCSSVIAVASQVKKLFFLLMHDQQILYNLLYSLDVFNWQIQT